MKKLATLMAVVAIPGLMLVSAPQDAEARLQYSKALATKYEKVKDAVTEQKCAVCHGGDPLGRDKKIRSEYAKALEKAIGKKNERDEDKISAAFDKVAKMPIKEGAEETYGQLLNDGKLPPPAPKEE